jgi:DMSO reductase anchor subunit
MEKVLLKSVQQKVWDWPAVIGLSLVGTGAGFYSFSFLALILSSDSSKQSQAIAFPLAVLLMIVLGFLAVATEAGSLLRSRYLLHRLRSSWMSVEVLTGIIFVVFVAIHIFLPNQVVMILAVVAALWLLLVQGLMVCGCRAVTAWNLPIIPILFFASGLCLGFGFWLVWTAAGKANFSLLILIVGLCFLVINSAMWANYLFRQRDYALRKATKPLRQSLTLTITLGLGSSLAALLVLFLILSIIFHLETIYLNRLSFFAGTAILAGGVYQRAAIVLKVNYLRALSAGEIKFHADKL